MASYRSVDKQVKYCVRQINGLGMSRAEAKAAGKVASVRTLESYKSIFTAVAHWMHDRRYLDGLHKLTGNQALEYLRDRAKVITQKTLDCETSALRKLTRADVVRVVSEFKAERQLAKESRGYTPAQIDAIAARQSPHNAIATRVAYEGGIRSFELHSLRAYDGKVGRPEKLVASRFAGKENWPRYQVTGKGGLVREVRVSPAIANELEKYRLAQPATVIDRKLRIEKHYSIGGGQSWAQSFSDASVRALGFSSGAHGVRHSFAQQSYETMCLSGFSQRDAKLCTSQLLGHWRPDITNCYLR